MSIEGGPLPEPEPGEENLGELVRNPLGEDLDEVDQEAIRNLERVLSEQNDPMTIGNSTDIPAAPYEEQQAVNMFPGLTKADLVRCEFYRGLYLNKKLTDEV